MTWGLVAIGGATVYGANRASSASKSAAATQAAAALQAGETSLEGLALQIAADKESVDKQIAAQKEALAQTIAAQNIANMAGERANTGALDKQLAAQQAALDQTLGLQREIYNKQVENLSSFTEAGEAGQSRLMDLLGLSENTGAPGFGSAATAFNVEGFDPGTLFENFNTQQMEVDPGYAFRLSEGQKAIDRSAAARGGLQSGAALKAAAEYGQNMGSQEYQNAYNRFQANKASNSQEYGNAFNRFQTERANRLAPLQSLQGVGQASAAGQATAAGNLASGSSQAIQNFGSGSSAAYGNYGANASNLASAQGNNQSAAYGNYGAGVSNIYGNSNAARQSAYGTNIANQMNAITGAANATAAGQIGSANAINNAVGQGVNFYGQYQQNQLMNKYLNQGGSQTPLLVGSDVTIKEDIRKIGVLDNGLNLYKFQYKPFYKDAWGHGEQIGVMAQEVEKVIPGAVCEHPDGYKLVNYAMI